MGLFQATGKSGRQKALCHSDSVQISNLRDSLHPLQGFAAVQALLFPDASGHASRVGSIWFFALYWDRKPRLRLASYFL